MEEWKWCYRKKCMERHSFQNLDCHELKMSSYYSCSVSPLDSCFLGAKVISTSLARFLISSRTECTSSSRLYYHVLPASIVSHNHTLRLLKLINYDWKCRAKEKIVLWSIEIWVHTVVVRCMTFLSSSNFDYIRSFQFLIL